MRKFSNLCKAVFVGIAMFLVSNSASAQIETLDKDGRAIILFPDNTWKYKDSTMVSGVAVETPKKTDRKAKPSKKKNDLVLYSENPTLDSIDASMPPAVVENSFKEEAPSQNGYTIRQAILSEDVPKPQVKKYMPFPTQQNSCATGFNAVDEFTARRKAGTKDEFFFGYTRPEDRDAMKGQHFLTCNASMLGDGAQRFLVLNYIVDSQYGRAEYGKIEQNSTMSLLLMDGQILTFTALKEDPGKMANGKTTFQTFYEIDAKSAKTLSKSEIDKVRMSWRVGEQDYEVYDLDFMKRALFCIDQIMK